MVIEPFISSSEPQAGRWRFRSEPRSKDAWAGAVEDLSDSLGVDLKHGEDKADNTGETWLELLKLAANCLERIEEGELSLEKLGQSVRDMVGDELTGYRRGQWIAVTMLVPYIRELSR